MEMKETKLKIAVQKGGRLNEDSIKLLKSCGIGLRNGVNQLKTEAEDFPLEVYFLRDDDIPQYVADAVADIGIVGENVFYEKNKEAVIVDKLGFGKCRLSLAIPKEKEYEGRNWLNQKKIATSYPHLVRRFLDENGLEAEVHEISGSVEIAPGIGLSDAVVDLVSSGSTLFMNGLQEVETILRSEAVMIRHPELNAEKLELLRKLQFRINAVGKAQKNKYILMNAPNGKLPEIINLLPGMKSPTVLPLAETGWSSVHSVVSENDFWNLIENLQEHGAEGILVIPIEKMII